MTNPSKSFLDRIGDAYRAFQNEAKPIMGEIAWADPWHLIPNNVFMVFNPDILVTRKGMQIYDRMRQDEQVKAALQFKKMAAIGTGWKIDVPADQPDDWDVARFVENQLTAMAGTFEDNLMQIMTALDYGFSVTEKVWEQVPDGEFAGLLGLKALKTRKPHFFGFNQDQYGNITAIFQTVRPDIILPREKFVLYAYNAEFSNAYGNSDLRAAYRQWWAKDNALKWMMMMLERYGVPPAIAIYDPTALSPNQIDSLKTVLTTMQAATNMVIPGRKAGATAEEQPVTLDFPQVAGQISTVFIPALEHFDSAISRALLMPGLLGITPDQVSGSLARSRKSFDMFMLLLDKLRQDLTEQVINEQIIRPLVDLNYTVEEYPQFAFLPITDEVRVDILDEWAKLVQAGAISSTPGDKAHIRELLDFPETKDGDSQDTGPETPEGTPPGGGNNPDGQDQAPENMKQYRQLTTFEKRVDFAQIEQKLNKAEVKAAGQLKEVIKRARDRVITRVRKSGPSLAMAKGLTTLGIATPFQNVLKPYLSDIFRQGRADLSKEVPRKYQADDGPNFVPQAAVAALSTDAATKAKALDAEIVEDIRRALVMSVTLGETGQQAADRLDQAFLPFLGDPKIGPTATTPAGGPLPAPRIENIVRTESTRAYNMGRLVEARGIGGDLMRGMQFSAVMDSRTTPVCQHLDGRVFKMGDPSLDALTPPLHFMCRSTLVPVTAADEVDPSDYITPGQAGKGIDLAGEGFT